MSEQPGWTRLQPALLRLEARRTARTQVYLFGIVVAALVWTSSTAVPLTSDGTGAPWTDAAGVRGLLRERIWNGALLVLLPLALWRAAGSATRWRAGEADWLAPRPTARVLVAAWSLAGTLLTTLAFIALAALCAEWSVGWTDAAGQATRRFAGSLDLPAALAIEPGESVQFTLPDPALDLASDFPASVRVHVTVIAGSAPTSSARMSAVRVGSAATKSAALPTTPTIIAGRTWLESPLPGGRGDVLVRVDNDGAGVLAVLDDASVEWWVTTGSERGAAVQLGARVALGLCAALPLAAGLGAWLSPATAATLVFLLWLLIGSTSFAGWFAAADLPQAIAIVAQGRLPSGLTPAALVGACACALLGGALLTAGSRSWKFAP